MTIPSSPSSSNSLIGFSGHYQKKACEVLQNFPCFARAGFFFSLGYYVSKELYNPRNRTADFCSLSKKTLFSVVVILPTSQNLYEIVSNIFLFTLGAFAGKNMAKNNPLRIS